MAEAILTDEQERKKRNLKELYNNYCESLNNSTESNKKEKSIYDVLNKDWKLYSEKIQSDDGLILEEYTNSLKNTKNNKGTLPNGYLCNFLERGSIAFGLSKGWSSNQYMVKRNADDSYYVASKKENVAEAEARKIYENDIKLLLKTLVEAEDINALVKIEEGNAAYKAYAGKQVLNKIALLGQFEKNVKSDFIFIYQREALNYLFTLFCEDLSTEEENDDIESLLEKNNKIALAAKTILCDDNKDITLEDRQKLSGFLWYLWEEENARIVTEKSPNVILYGPPGTGKTYTVKRSISLLTHNDSDLSEFVQFHPSFTYEDFIDGLKPIGVKSDGNMKFEFVNGYFKDFCIQAKKAMEETIEYNNDKKNEYKKEIPVYYFVVDEINRANLSAVFGETLSLIEADYRDYRKDENDKKSEYKRNLIKTQNCKILETMIEKAEKDDKDKLAKLAYYYNPNAEEGKKVQFGIPSNIRFIGMMNDVDKSIDSFDLALRRRFKWEQKKCDYGVIKDYFTNPNTEIIDDYAASCEKLNEYISKELGLGSSYEFGHSFFMKLPKDKKITKTAKTELYKNYLEPTLREYLRAFFDESEIENKLKEAFEKFNPTSKKTNK